MARAIDIQNVIEEIKYSLEIPSYGEHDKGFDHGLEYVLDLIEKSPTLTPPNEWVSVEERLPNSQEDVLVVAFWHERWQTMVGWHSDMGRKWRIITPHGEREPGGVTHWMPFPAPPDRRPPEGEER